ncbi:Putative coat protein [Lentibacillus halodurans]|uniref:Putative coat protein n=1 Tax=Lentibacillus halodurans TaxID=237679 RepID=A0A1I0Z0G9_9BACI|nr:spore coat protein YlbD [Lentibacillus halodurans]SFB18606.1 Putative coat protein [Lentibacillus halodurans]
MSNKLHPSVREFKAFLQKHPRLVEEARKSGRGFQEYYEKWALLGEHDQFWEQYKEKRTGEADSKPKQGKAELMERLVQMSENIDLDKLQKQVDNVNNTITTIQGLLGQFQSSQNPSHQPFRNQNLFNGFKD